MTPARLGGDANIFDVIRAGDLLVHHPYDSFDDSVERFISTAADDPHTDRHQDDGVSRRR